MKRQSIITLVVILALAGAISYGIIWWRKRASAGSAANTTDNGSDSSNKVNTGTSVNTGYSLPKINSYAWYTTALGHAAFPLKKGSKGVEVVAVQERLNYLAGLKKITPELSTDGNWGAKTEERFKLLNPSADSISENEFYLLYDPELLTK